MEKFKTEVDLSITGSHDMKGGSGKATVEWVFEIEMRKYGVKDISIIAPDQTITTYVSRYDEEADEEYEEKVTLELKNVKVDSSLSGYERLTSYLSSGIYPKELEIWRDQATLLF